MDDRMMDYLKKQMQTLIRIMADHASLFVFMAVWIALGWLLQESRYTAFLHPRFEAFLVIGFVIISAFIIVLVFGEKQPVMDTRMREMITSAVLLVPLVFMYVISEQGMGNHTLAKKYTGNELQYLSDLMGGMSGNDKSALNDKEVTLLDIAKNKDRLKGRRVVTEGLVYQDSCTPKDHMILFRFTIFCCAADSIPVWVLIKMNTTDPIENDTWIEVDGTLDMVRMAGNDVPVIQADTIRPKKKPSPGKQYLFY